MSWQGHQCRAFNVGFCAENINIYKAEFCLAVLAVFHLLLFFIVKFHFYLAAVFCNCFYVCFCFSLQSFLQSLNLLFVCRLLFLCIGLLYLFIFIVCLLVYATSQYSLTFALLTVNFNCLPPTPCHFRISFVEPQRRWALRWQRSVLGGFVSERGPAGTPLPCTAQVTVERLHGHFQLESAKLKGFLVCRPAHVPNGLAALSPFPGPQRNPVMQVFVVVC